MMFNTLTPHLITLTTQVGELIMSYYKTSLTIETKSDQTPLTVVDQTAHQLLSATLKQLTPNVPIIS